ncbi:putative glycosyl transferase, family 14 [Helianthus annuus]|nr:putative glycosyl transferase, family 14 [Helianthus annuus]
MEAQYRRIGASSMLAQKPKIAFLFLAGNRLPLDLVWDQFFQGENENRFSIYFKACLTGRSKYFLDRQVNNNSIQWVILTRKHAEIIVKDEVVFPMFQRHCQASGNHYLSFGGIVLLTSTISTMRLQNTEENGAPAPCFLFARKFTRPAAMRLLHELDKKYPY